MLDQLIKDLAYGLSGLRRDRSFTLTTLATLTVGLSLVTIVFAIFNAYVLRPYAVRDPYSLYELRWSARDGSRWASGREFRWQDYESLRARHELFVDVLAERNRTVWFEGRPLIAAFVSGNYFEMLGGRIQAGRALDLSDARARGAEPNVVLSDNAWTDLFDRDPAIVGRTIRLSEQVLTIVGVAHEAFQGINDTPPELWLPATMHGPVMKQDLFAPSQPRAIAVTGRVRRGLSAEQVAAALSPGMQQMTGEAGTVRAEVYPQATPAPLTSELMVVLSPVFAAFVLVLVAACANVSNVMLARASARQREIGIRLSLGASRWRVVRQLVTEGLMIAALSAAAALAVAAVALRAGLALFFMTIPPTFAAVARVLPLDLDHRVFIFTAALATLATILFAVVPALQGTRLTLTRALRGEFGGGMRGSRLRSVLVIGQVAVSVVLIVAAATLVRNGSALERIDTGFDTRRLVSLKPSGRLLARAHQALAADPRIEHAVVTSHNPLTGEMPKAPVRKPHGTMVPVTYMHVSPDYFAALQLPISRGRGFEPAEARAEAPVAVISAAAAHALWPGEDPLGKTMRVLMAPEPRPDVMTRGQLVSQAELASAGQEVMVVGVTTDAVTGMIYNGRSPHIYLPTALGARHSRHLLVRGRSVQDVRTDVLQAILRDVDNNPLAFPILALDEALALQMYPLKVASWIGLLLSTVALVLSVSGLYGVVTYGLSQRTREIGIRIALGATPSRIVQLVMRQSGRLVAIGAALGLIASFSVLAMLAAFVPLQNVSFFDARAFLAGAGIVGLAAAVAAFLPSRRAANTDPSNALRAET